MNKYAFILLLSILTLIHSASCERKTDKFSITIVNHSDKEIIFIGSVYSSVAQDTGCIKPTTRLEYGDFIYSNMIKPYSSKKIGIDGLVEHMQTYPDIIKWWSLGIFNRIDMDTMSCEEFEEKYPLKKEWKVTLADMQACDWTLVYEPDSIE